jgi:hypothetical protein
MTRSPEMSWKSVENAPARFGYDITFRAKAVMDDGRSYGRETVVSVAPHDPRLERRSIRGTAVRRDATPE